MLWEGVTVEDQRENLVKMHLRGHYTVSELAERFSVSRKTAHKWISRYEEEGRKGLAEHSRRPKASPKALAPEVKAELLRRQGAPGPLHAPRVTDVRRVVQA